MRGGLWGAVPGSGATVDLEHGDEAALLAGRAGLGTRGLVRQMERRPVRP
jgi:hypothetical protein